MLVQLPGILDLLKGLFKVNTFTDKITGHVIANKMQEGSMHISIAAPFSGKIGNYSLSRIVVTRSVAIDDNTVDFEKLFRFRDDLTLLKVRLYISIRKNPPESNTFSPQILPSNVSLPSTIRVLNCPNQVMDVAW